MPLKMKEILDKQTDQLRHELVEQQKHLFDLRSQAVTEKLEDPSQLLKVRRDIARMKTILRQRQIEQERKGDNGSAAKKTEKQTEPRTAKRTMKKTVKKKTTRKRTKEKAPATE